ncbi:MAG: sigma-70 family RNA polymerase sigma factor [Candidatus Eisenbacteria bacterium]|nr:sigma-70 family RNA polymerase sigma factor [Candidatus Eisenbacteria bacterium]
MPAPGGMNGPAVSDRDLVARALGGDDSAYAELVSRYADLVHTIAARIVGEADAEDVAQEAFVRAHGALAGFRGDSKFSSWLYRIAVNRSLTHLKRRRRRPEPVDLGPGADGLALTLPSRGPDPERLVLDDEFRRRVRRAVGALPPRYRAAVTLFYLEERNYAEVAGALGIPVNTLKTHLHRARAMLREALADEASERGRNE